MLTRSQGKAQPSSTARSPGLLLLLLLLLLLGAVGQPLWVVGSGSAGLSVELRQGCLQPEGWS